MEKGWAGPENPPTKAPHSTMPAEVAKEKHTPSAASSPTGTMSKKTKEGDDIVQPGGVLSVKDPKGPGTAEMEVDEGVSGAKTVSPTTDEGSNPRTGRREEATGTWEIPMRRKGNTLPQRRRNRPEGKTSPATKTQVLRPEPN